MNDNNNNYYDNHGDDYNHNYDCDTHQEQKQKYKKKPEYVKCVSSQNERNVSWCGVRSIDWMFQNVDHALNSGKTRLLVCEQCAKEINRWIMCRTGEQDPGV